MILCFGEMPGDTMDAGFGGTDIALVVFNIGCVQLIKRGAFEPCSAKIARFPGIRSCDVDA